VKERKRDALEGMVKEACEEQNGQGWEREQEVRRVWPFREEGEVA